MTIRLIMPPVEKLVILMMFPYMLAAYIACNVIAYGANAFFGSEHH
jgi:hypothetical protein